MPKAKQETVSLCSEVIIDKTLYRISRVFLGEKDFKQTLEKLTVKRIYDEITSPQKAVSGGQVHQNYR